MRLDTSDPAFPSPLDHNQYYGITKREYAAIHILSGLLANPCNDGQDPDLSFVKQAFEVADMFMAEATK